MDLILIFPQLIVILLIFLSFYSAVRLFAIKVIRLVALPVVFSIYGLASLGISTSFFRNVMISRSGRKRVVIDLLASIVVILVMQVSGDLLKLNGLTDRKLVVSCSVIIALYVLIILIGRIVKEANDKSVLELENILKTASYLKMLK